MKKRRTIFDMAEGMHLDAVEQAVDNLMPIPPPLFTNATVPIFGGLEVIETEYMPEGMALLKSGDRQYLFSNGNMVELPPAFQFINRMSELKP